jgi:hypothetical protein
MVDAAPGSPPVPGREQNWVYVEEILPDNEKSHAIMMKRQQEENERLEKL